MGWGSGVGGGAHVDVLTRRTNSQAHNAVQPFTHPLAPAPVAPAGMMVGMLHAAVSTDTTSAGAEAMAMEAVSR